MAKLLFLLFGFLKLGKVTVTLGSMLLSFAVYAGLWGWRFAAGFVLLLLVHEMGHFLAARQRGLRVGAPTFIPFVGAWIELKEQPMDVETEAYVAAAGPFAGTVAATLVYFLARDEHSRLLLAIAYSGLFLNFFNLIPLAPLDGGRMTAILSPRIWFIGAPLMLLMLYWRPSPLLVLMLLLSIPSLIQAWKFDPTAPATRAYYFAETRTRIEYGVFYLGLATFLAIMTQEVHVMLDGGDAGLF
jgi:Zn-dependent protease